MAKSSKILFIFLASAAVFLSFLRAVQADSRFLVEGKVYCDTCRAQFVTKVSQFMEGATVRLECMNRVGGEITFSVEGTTDKEGTYCLPVDDEHEEEICEVVLVKSNVTDCGEISSEVYLKRSARISLTVNSGISSPVRWANPLGFLRKDPLPECDEILRELGITGFDEVSGLA